MQIFFSPVHLNGFLNYNTEQQLKTKRMQIWYYICIFMIFRPWCIHNFNLMVNSPTVFGDSFLMWSYSFVSADRLTDASLYLSNRPQVSVVYKVINHAGCWQNTRRICKPRAAGEWFTNSSSVLPTSQVVYQLINHRNLWSIAFI